MSVKIEGTDEIKQRHQEERRAAEDASTLYKAITHVLDYVEQITDWTYKWNGKHGYTSVRFGYRGAVFYCGFTQSSPELTSVTSLEAVGGPEIMLQRALRDHFAKQKATTTKAA